MFRALGCHSHVSTNMLCILEYCPDIRNQAYKQNTHSTPSKIYPDNMQCVHCYSCNRDVTQDKEILELQLSGVGDEEEEDTAEGDRLMKENASLQAQVRALHDSLHKIQQVPTFIITHTQTRSNKYRFLLKSASAHALLWGS